MDQAVVQSGEATLIWRRAMVDNQIRTFDVTDQRVLDPFYRVPREAFLSGTLADLAYSDAPLVVEGSAGTRRTLLVPMVLARMLQGIDPLATDRALVVGGGTGYPAAILAAITASVVSLESDAGLSTKVGTTLAALGVTNVETVTGKLDAGHVPGGPYNVILVCGAVECGLEPLFAQLAPGGRLAAIQSGHRDPSKGSSRAVCYERFGADISSRVLFDAAAPVFDEFRKPAVFVF